MANRVRSSSTSSNNTAKKKRRRHPFPNYSLEHTLAIAKAIAENNAGKPYSRISLADSIDRSPDARQFRDLISASSAYGLTQGGYSAPQISLTALGQSIVTPRYDTEYREGLIKAAMNIDLFKKLFEHFDQHKIPPINNFQNTLARDYGVDPTLTEKCVQHFLEDGKFVGLIRHSSGADRVDVSHADRSSNGQASSGVTSETGENATEAPNPEIESVISSQPRSDPVTVNQRVFITHGKNREIVQQLKDLISFGKLEPVVATEEETPSKRVPDKVMESMRSCFTGIIHVNSEAELLDRDGNIHHRINENVLIEIGAAMALFNKNFILLVQKNVHLPSNLQGLYRCDYEGDRLDYDATMKLLKTISQFS